MENEVKLSVNIPRMTISVDYVATDTLVGALCVELVERNLIKDIGILDPTEIVFLINKAHPNVDLYSEINKVRDFMKIDEKKIIVFIKQS